LTGELKHKFKATLRESASPRQVPASILETLDILYTLKVKKVESAVTIILKGRAVTDQDGLVDPASLDWFEKMLRKLK